MIDTILVTGAGGMVGQNLLPALRATRFNIVAPTRQELDLTDYSATVTFLSRVSPEFIIHLAGRVGGIQANIREPVRFLVENWDVGRNIVLAARAVGVKKLINLGSSCMYPRDRQGAIKETEVLAGPLEPTNEGYALAKIAVARLCEYVHRETPSCDYKTLIPCNLYGPHDKFDPAHSHLIPAVIRKLHLARARGEEHVEIWGDGTARREFMFVGDLVDVFLRALDHYNSLPPIANVGLGFDYSVNDYYQAAAEVIGYKGDFVHDLTKPVGMARKLTDITAIHAWGWKAKIDLRAGLEKTYEFFLGLGS